MDFAFIRKSVPILETASRLGLAVTRNRSRCLFPERHSHGDRTPSLTFNPATNSFKCWVCDDVHGSVIDLVMLVRGLDFKGAIAFLEQEGWLKGVTGMSPSPPNWKRSDKPSFSTKFIERTTDTPARLSHEKRIEIFQHFIQCCDTLSSADSNYLKSRRIFSKTVNRQKLCAIRNYEETAARIEECYDRTLLLEAGLFNDKGHLRFYKHRLILPYWWEGRPVYFQARAIDPEVKPKELNPSGSIPIPYNIDATQSSPLIYLCEGVIDTLTLIEQGFPAVGIPGAKNFKEEWTVYFKNKRVFSVFDADAAGKAGNEKLKTIFAKEKIYFEVIRIPEGSDVNDLFTGKMWKNRK